MALTADGDLVPGSGQGGRGAWVCAGSVACLNLAERRRAFDRAFGRPVDISAVDRLRRTLGRDETGVRGGVDHPA